jgi:hypothetical protein
MLFVLSHITIGMMLIPAKAPIHIDANGKVDIIGLTRSKMIGAADGTVSPGNH